MQPPPRNPAGRLLCCMALSLVAFGEAGVCVAAGAAPQMRTSARLLNLGESIRFDFRLGGGAAGALAVFPCYMEQARPGALPAEGGNLRWLDALPHETIPIRVEGAIGSAVYTPLLPGNYMARWTVGGEELYRHFAAVQPGSIVATFSTFEGLDPEMTLHGVGIPVDYRLPIERFRPGDLLLREFLGFHRRYGETIVPVLPDMPDAPAAVRLERYREGLALARGFFAEPRDFRSARVEMHHELDPGYTATLASLGVNEHCGMWEANAKPWLGMPEFPYFASSVDCRKARQEPGGAVVAHQWDFCGGWHFFGPVSWHYKAARGDWKTTERCLRMALDEFRELARMSGHPAFVTPLYDGLAGPGYPNPAFQYQQRDPRTFHGLVEDAFVTTRAMDAAQVARIMARGLAEVPTPAFAWPPPGKLTGNARWVEGRAGKSLRLDGQHGCFATKSTAVVGGAEFTLGCWVKPEATQSTWANILSNHKSLPDGTCRGVSIEQSGDTANRYYLLCGLGKQWLGTGITTQLKAGVWQHFAVSRRGRTLTHYLNGAVSATGDVGEATFSPSGEPWRIGDWARGDVVGDSGMREFVDRYRRFAAFEATKQYPLVYTRSIDITDYYRRHFQHTPRTVFVSATDHLDYDKWWLCHWCNMGTLVTKDLLPHDMRMADEFERRRKGPYFKDPLSLEYILVEDHRRSVRFERECPNPVWWFDYTRQEKGPRGSAITHTETPEVRVERSDWVREGNSRRMTLRMHTAATMPDYAVALWNLPTEFNGDRAKVRTNAKEFVVAWNRNREYRLVLFFDLKPDAQLRVEIVD